MRCLSSSLRLQRRRCSRSGLTIPELFLVAALMNAAVAAFIYRLVPEFLLRFVAWLVAHAAVSDPVDRHRAPAGGRSGRSGLQSRQLRRRRRDHGREPAADPLRDGSQHLQDSGASHLLQPAEGDSDRVGETRSGYAAARSSKHPARVGRRRDGLHFSRGPDYRHRRAVLRSSRGCAASSSAIRCR